MKNAFPDVHSYYNHTGFDYRNIWNRRRNDVAVHFGYYDEHASRHADTLDNMNRVLADMAGIRAGERVLDAGCGMGNSCFWLAEHRQAQVTGINIVKSQIEACRSRAQSKHTALVDFAEADFCQMPFENDRFDVIWACESICHASEKAAFYREAFRVLKPGGRLVMAEYMRTGRPLSDHCEHLLRAWLHPWAIPDIDTAEQHCAYAQEAGLRVAELRDVTANVQVSLRNLHEISSRWLPFGTLLSYVRLVGPVRLGNARASVRQYEALLAGAWKYGMLLAVK